MSDQPAAKDEQSTPGTRSSPQVEPSAAERDTETDLPPPSPPATSGRTVVRSGEPPSADPEQDTLLSAPQPADAFEVQIEDRMRVAERRIEELENRLKYLERKAPIPTDSAKPWLLWLVFFLCLALAWQLVAQLR